MKYIKEITPKECNDGLKKYFEVATVDDFWEVKGMYAMEGDKCYQSLDGNVYFLCQNGSSNFVYFALEPGKMSNIRATYEVLYELVCEGVPFLRVNGKDGRYGHFLNHFGHYTQVNSAIPEHEEFIWYIGHPDTVRQIRLRIGRN